MLVIKRDGRKESVKFDKITARIEKLSYGLNTEFVKTIEIAKKVNEDFDEKKLPLMLSMINAIVENKKLEFNWEAFR